MSQQFAVGDTVVVTNPMGSRAHTKGWRGKLDRKGKGNTWHVTFLGGRRLYHVSELEPAPPEAQSQA